MLCAYRVASDNAQNLHDALANLRWALLEVDAEHSQVVSRHDSVERLIGSSARPPSSFPPSWRLARARAIREQLPGSRTTLAEKLLEQDDS